MSKACLFLFCASCILTRTFNAQNAYEEYNIWTGVTATYDPGKKTGFVIDAGFRSFDHFSRKRKQLFGRFVLLLNVTRKSSFGGGFAYFNHTSYSSGKSRNRDEFRPFLQYQFRLRKSRHDLLIRARNEFRSFQDPGSLRDRFRIQARYAFQLLKPRLQLVCSAEIFYTFQEMPTREQRYNIGLSIPMIYRTQINPYYSLQLVSNLPVVQHVIGLQLLVNLDTENKDRKKT